MKELLVKLIRSTVCISFKSGDKLNNVVIEAVIGNTIIATYGGKVTLIEIPHIAYVSAETGIMEILETILKNKQSDQKQEKKDDKKDDKKDEKKDDKK